LRVELTDSWSPEKFAPYGASVTAAMRKLQERFPREVTVEHLAREIIEGKRQCWLFLDDDDRFISFVLTSIEVNNANGLKTLHIPSYAGEEGAACVPLIGKIEDWARSKGCDAVLVYGRRGWKRPLAKEGYAEDMCLFRKNLA